MNVVLVSSKMKKSLADIIKNTPDIVLLGVVSVIKKGFADFVIDNYNPHVVIFEHNIPIKSGVQITDSITLLKRNNPKIRIIYYYGDVQNQQDFEMTSEILIENEVTEIVLGEKSLERLSEIIINPMTPNVYIKQFADLKFSEKPQEVIVKQPEKPPKKVLYEPPEEKIEEIIEVFPKVKKEKKHHKVSINFKKIIIPFVIISFLLALPVSMYFFKDKIHFVSASAASVATSDINSSSTSSAEEQLNTSKPVQNSQSNVDTSASVPETTTTSSGYVPSYPGYTYSAPDEKKPVKPVTTQSPGKTTTAPQQVTTAPSATTQAPAPAQTTAATTNSQPVSPITPILINTISLSQYSNITISVNLTYKVTPSILPANATNKNLTWVSNKPLIAVVDSNGVINAKGYGKAIITCWTTDGTNLSASCMVTVQ